MISRNLDSDLTSRGLSIKFMFSVATVYSARPLTIFVSQTAGTKVHFLMSSTGQQFGLQRSIGLGKGKRKGRKRETERERDHDEAALEKIRGSLKRARREKNSLRKEIYRPLKERREAEESGERESNLCRQHLASPRIIGSAEALPILCVRYARGERERERERERETERDTERERESERRK